MTSEEKLPVGALFIATWRGGVDPDLRVRTERGSRLLYNDEGKPTPQDVGEGQDWETTVRIHPLTEDDGIHLLAVLALNREQGIKLMHELSR